MKNLKNLRKANSLSLTQLSSKVGISQQMLSCYELGQTNPPLDAIFKLADYFGCSIDFLLGHQTATILQLDMLSKSQQELFGLMKKMTDKQIDKLIGYANSLLSVPLDDVVDKIYNEGRK